MRDLKADLELCDEIRGADPEGRLMSPGQLGAYHDFAPKAIIGWPEAIRRAQAAEKERDEARAGWKDAAQALYHAAGNWMYEKKRADKAEDMLEAMLAVADAARSVLEWLKASGVQGAQVDLLRAALKGVGEK